MVDVGQTAPDFTLRDQDGAEVTLSSFRGERNVVLIFYPLAFTGVCQGELCAVRDDLSRFQNDDVQVLTVSVDSVPTHKKWAEEQGYTFPLLSDFWPHGATATAYGVFNAERGLATRGTFVIDKQGVVRWKVENAIPDARDQAEYLQALASLA
ncbi:MAG TPA: peroxiredoxin [Mycobacteriales bacterium]|nr:peroxiredoxin [Mycobacteriales bacterium]